MSLELLCWPLRFADHDKRLLDTYGHDMYVQGQSKFFIEQTHAHSAQRSVILIAFIRGVNLHVNLWGVFFSRGAYLYGANMERSVREILLGLYVFFFYARGVGTPPRQK